MKSEWLPIARAFAKRVPSIFNVTSFDFGPMYAAMSPK